MDNEYNHSNEHSTNFVLGCIGAVLAVAAGSVIYYVAWPAARFFWSLL